MRKGNRASPIPLISQLKILDDIKAGMTQATISRDYGCTPRAIYTILHKGSQWSGPLPSGFELLVGNPKVGIFIELRVVPMTYGT